MTTYTNEQLRQIDAQVAQVMGIGVPSREYAMAELGYRAIRSTGPAYGDWSLHGIGTIESPPPGANLRQPDGHSDWNMRYGLWIAQSYPTVVTEEMVAEYRLPALHYTTNIADAWRCIGYMRERGWSYRVSDQHSDEQWACFLRSYADGRTDWKEAKALTASLAICLAFLAANGVEVQA